MMEILRQLVKDKFSLLALIVLVVIYMALLFADFLAPYTKDFSDIENYLKDNLQSGDILLTIGAGNVYKIGEELIEG